MDTRYPDTVKKRSSLRPRADLKVRTVDGEAVVLDKESGTVHHLNATASFIWSQMDGRTSTAQLVERVAAEFEVDAEVASRDVNGLIKQFQALHLLERAVGGAEEAK